MQAAFESTKNLSHNSMGPRCGSSAPCKFTNRHLVLALQQQAGNQAVQSLLRSRLIQAKLTISQPDDPDEREADQVADRVMRSRAGAPVPSPCLCRSGEEICEECQQERNATVERRVSNVLRRQPAKPQLPRPRDPEDSHAAAALFTLRRDGGQPLDPQSRAFFESRFEHDFGHVRLHTGGQAAESARTIEALAYTAGNHIVFGASQYQPSSEQGKRLLAHELAHVVQQDRRPRHSDNVRRQAGLVTSADRPLPKDLQSLSANDKRTFRQLVIRGAVPRRSSAERLTGEREHDTTILAEYFLCAYAWSADVLLAGGIDDPLFCVDSPVTRGSPLLAKYRKAVIEPEYDNLPAELLKLLQTRQALMRAIAEDLIYIGDKKASPDDKDPQRRLAAALYSAFERQLTQGQPTAEAEDSPLPVPQLLEVIKTLTDAARVRKTGPSAGKVDFAIISLLRPQDSNGPHKPGRAVDISIYAGKRLEMFYPEEALNGLIQLLEDLPPGKYWVGLPRQPRRDFWGGCTDYNSRIFQPYLSRLYLPNVRPFPFCWNKWGEPPHIRQEILNTRNMFFPPAFTPGNTASLDQIMDPEAKARLKEVTQRKAPGLTVNFGPDALDHVHVQLD